METKIDIAVTLVVFSNQYLNRSNFTVENLTEICCDVNNFYFVYLLSVSQKC